MHAARDVPSEWCYLEWDGLPAPSSSSSMCPVLERGMILWRQLLNCGNKTLQEECGLWVLHLHTQTPKVPHISGLLLKNFFFFKHDIVLVHHCYENCWYTQMYSTMLFSVLFKIYLGLTISVFPGSVTVVYTWILL